MPVLDGSPVSAAVTDAAFLDKTQDDTKIGKLALHDPSSANVDDVQLRLNNLKSATNDGSETYTSQKRITTGQNYPTALSNLDSAFHETTGHPHDGTAGGGPKLATTSITGNPLRGFFQQATDLSALTGGSVVVTTQMSGKPISSSSTVEGVVITGSYNRCILRNSANDDQYFDGAGNTVYGRITVSAGIWTLTFYSEVSGIETAFSFSVSSAIRWYYQQLYNPLTDAPVYDPAAIMPSDTTTLDVLTATTTQQGKTQLDTVGGGDIASAAAAGTANGLVANANHTHKGVGSFSKTSGTKRYGDISLTPGANVTITDNADGTFTIASTSGVVSFPSAISSTCSVWTNVTSSYADITNLSVALTPTAGTVALFLIPDGSASPAYAHNHFQILTIKVQRSDNGGSTWTDIGVAQCGTPSSVDTILPPGSIYFEDTGFTPGNSTMYKLQGKGNGVGPTTYFPGVQYCKLSVHQI